MDVGEVWSKGRKGSYAMMDEALARFGERYDGDYRALAVGPAAAATDFAGIVSAPVKKGKATHVDTWAGRGGRGRRPVAESPK